MTVTWENLVEIAVGLGKAEVKTVCNSQSGYTLLPPKMEVLATLEGCEPPEHIRIDKIGVFMNPNYIQTQKMLYNIYATRVPNPVPYNQVRIHRDFPSNEGLVF